MKKHDFPKHIDDEVNANWLGDQLDAHKKSLIDVASWLGIAKSAMSQYRSGGRYIPKTTKAALYYYFQTLQMMNIFRDAGTMFPVVNPSLITKRIQK